MAETKSTVTTVPNAVAGTIVGGGMSAAVSWLSGVALKAGYHVSVPFLPTWLGAFAGLVALSTVATLFFRSYHLHKAQFAALIASEEHKGIAYAERELKAEALATMTQAMKKA